MIIRLDKITVGLILPALIVILFSSCKQEPPIIHSLDQLAYDQTLKENTSPYKTFTVRMEYYVISNPPKDSASLNRLIVKYNNVKLNQNRLKKYFAVIQVYYRETHRTPRNYKEKHSGYFNRDTIDRHEADIIAVVKWLEYGKQKAVEFKHELLMQNSVGSDFEQLSPT